MLLRRFISHVNEQNWFAVGLDVIVVVVGIFLGMQVTDWNENRNLRIEERDYLISIVSDLELSVPTLEKEIRLLEEKSKGTQEAYRMLYFDELSNDTRAEFLANYFSIFHFSGLQANVSTMLELQSGGKLSLIQAPDIRKSITLFLSDFDAKQYYYRERLAAMNNDLFLRLSEVAIRNYEGDDLLTSNEELNNSEDITQLVRMLAWSQQRASSAQQELLDSVSALKDKIEAHLDTNP